MNDQILDRYAADITNRFPAGIGLGEDALRRILRHMGVELAAAIVGTSHDAKLANDLTQVVMEPMIGKQDAERAHRTTNAAIEGIENLQLRAADKLLGGFTAEDLIAAAKYRGDQRAKSRRDDLVLEKTQNLVLHGKDATYPASEPIPFNTDGIASGRFSHERQGQGPNYGIDRTA